MSITAQRARTGTLAFAVTAGVHTLVSDVETGSGGEDLGPSPHDLFDAALAACTGLTVKMYAARKNWPLTDIRVEVVRDSSREAAGHYKLTRRIELVGALDETQAARLIEIANKCPVHKLMHAEIEVVTQRV